jgi:nitrogenase molybdenum-iron protein alpha/beta subunit
MLRNSDMAGAEEAAERMKKVIAIQFPGVIEDEGEEGSPEQMQAQLAKLKGENQQLAQALNQATDEAMTKKAETESRERIAGQANETKVVLEQMKQEFQAALQDDQQQHEARMETLKGEIQGVLAEVKQALAPPPMMDRSGEMSAMEHE